MALSSTSILVIVGNGVMRRHRQDDKKQRITCPECGRDVAITKAGWVMNHGSLWITSEGKRIQVKSNCIASMTPLDMAKRRAERKS